MMRWGHAAVVLPGDRIMVVGGCTAPDCENKPGKSLSEAELYDPLTEHWSFLAPMKVPLYQPSAVLLDNGLVLVAGEGPEVELYDPASNRWRQVTSLPQDLISAIVLLWSDCRITGYSLVGNRWRMPSFTMCKRIVGRLSLIFRVQKQWIIEPLFYPVERY